MGWLTRLLFGDLYEQLQDISERLDAIEEALAAKQRSRIIVVPTGVENR